MPRLLGSKLHRVSAGLAALLLGLAACSPAPAGPLAGTLLQRGQPTTAPAVAGPEPTRAPTATPAPTSAPTAVPTTAPTATPVRPKVAVNELGTIPILEYHVIANAEEDQWTRTPASFRKDLEKLYAAGFRPVSMADYLDNKIGIPAGTSPVVFTFDDSSPGHFRYLERDGQVVVDPDSAVGMLEEFHRTHADWDPRGAFYVLPEAAQPHKLFGQPKYEAQKLRYLAERGFEIGNHTWWHQRLDTVSDAEVQRQLAFAVRSIQQAVPGYNVRSFALPLGEWPKNRGLAFRGSYEGVSYKHDAVVLVGAEPAPSPYRKGFDPKALPRVQVFGDNLDRWLAYLAKSPDERYVSDGDPNVVSYPTRLGSHLNPASTSGKTVQSG